MLVLPEQVCVWWRRQRLQTRVAMPPLRGPTASEDSSGRARATERPLLVARGAGDDDGREAHERGLRLALAGAAELRGHARHDHRGGRDGASRRPPRHYSQRGRVACNQGRGPACARLHPELWERGLLAGGREGALLNERGARGLSVRWPLCKGLRAARFLIGCVRGTEPGSRQLRIGYATRGVQARLRGARHEVARAEGEQHE
mmetsp:Transcript_30121/g.99585  ORF Transcript_30121/g.99585 Transcript_30121/m.99585 type:complete len:204 (+) Transcript_30121:352-963(+)